MRSSRRRGRSFGFTLIELVIVLTLLVIVIGLAAPRLAGFMSGRNTNEEARRLLSVTNYARSEAVSRGVRMEVRIDPQEGTYEVRPETVDPLDEAPTTKFHCFDGVSLYVDPNSLDDDQTAAIVFWPDGAIDAASVDRVTIREEDKDVFELVLDDTEMEYTLEKPSDEEEF